jgi:hypothetical protein
VVLTEFEMTRRYRRPGNELDFVDLCNSCFEWIRDSVDVIERKDLKDQLDDDE